MKVTNGVISSNTTNVATIFFVDTEDWTTSAMPIHKDELENELTKYSKMTEELMNEWNSYFIRNTK